MRAAREQHLLGGVGRIAVLRANALGDFLLSLPAMEALRAAYPDAELTLLGRPWHAGFVSGRPSPIDRVIAVPVSRGVREEADEAPDAGRLARFFEEMRGERFDLALQLHGGGQHSNPFVQRLGARVTAGSRAAGAPSLDRTVPYLLHQHETLRFLEVVRLVGAPAVTLEPRVAVTAEDRGEAAAWTGAGEGPLAVLHPGAMDARRRWPPERFAAVGDRLCASGFRVAVTGSANEHDTAERVVRAMRAPGAENVAGALSLGGLAALLEHAAMLVSNDTGPRHLAAAVGTRTVSIYWFRNVLNTAPLAAEGHRVAIAWRARCPVCGMPCEGLVGGGCAHRVSLLGEITVEQVWACVEELLDDAGPV